jgi:hypothetical protein
MELNAYTQIPKGRGFVYAHGENLYRQVKKKGEVLYLKCHIATCDGSAKIQHGEFIVGVSMMMCFFLY